MVIKTASGIYMHAAWANDEEGTGFSLIKFDAAQYVGNYSDKSAVESTNWRKYSWQAIQSADDEEDDGAEIVEDESEPDDEEEAEADGDIISSDDVIEGLMDDIGDTAEEVQSVGADSTATQNLSDTGLGNDNLLSGTNCGLSGWTIPDGFSAEAVNGTIYDETSDALNYIKITCGTAGAGILQFSAGDLPEKLAQDGGNGYALSADIAMSTCFSLPAYVGKPDGTAKQIEFGTIDNAARDLEEDSENDGVWVPAALTAGALGVAADGQVLCFDLSAMPSGATLEIANLKIEEGAMVTPWKKSIKEVAETADGATSAASAAQTAAEAADGKAAAAQSTASKAKTAAAAAQKTADQAQIVANSALQGTKENTAQMAQMVINFNGDIENLQDQIDGNITTWFYDVDPAMSLPPVTDWDTDEKKDAHLGDIYYNTVKGYAWRFMKSGSIYSWERITDTDVTKALADAAKAQDTADSKRRIFYNTPTVPYDAGDLWVQGSGGDILRCAQAKTSTGSYDRSDWVLASKYTDNSALNTWIEGDFAATIKELEDGLVDAKVETYYQTTDPSTGWSDTQKSEHKGDLWYNSTASVQKYYRWSGTAWQELTATPPQAVFDNIDKKATIYTGTTTPTNPDSGDLWFKGADEPILTYVNNSWVEYNKYTDDTAANAAKATADTAQSTAAAAQSAASNAQTTADTAKKNASAAQTAAEAAQSTADNAQTAADSASSAAASAQSAASNAQTTADTAQSGVDTLNTYIRSRDDGVEVARKDADGNYVGFKTIHTADGVEVRTADDVVVARYGNSVKIGEDATSQVVIDSQTLQIITKLYKLYALSVKTRSIDTSTDVPVEFDKLESGTVPFASSISFSVSVDPAVGEYYPIADFIIHASDGRYHAVMGVQSGISKTETCTAQKEIDDIGGGTVSGSLTFTATYDGAKTFTLSNFSTSDIESAEWHVSYTVLSTEVPEVRIQGDSYISGRLGVSSRKGTVDMSDGDVSLTGKVDALEGINTDGTITIKYKDITEMFSGLISIGFEDKSLSIAAGGNTGESTINLSKSGYSARCICGWNMSGTGSSNCVIPKLFINQTGQQIHYYVKNTGSSKATPTLRIYILYTKNN